MGNNNSSQGNRSINPSNNTDPINDFQQTVNNMYDKIMGREYKYQPQQQNIDSDVFRPTVDSDYDVLSTNKGSFPYMISNNRLSESDPTTTSDIRVIEIYDCDTNIDENDVEKANANVKRYVVHKKKPDHQCGANCPCIQEKNRCLFSPVSTSIFDVEFSPAYTNNPNNSKPSQNIANINNKMQGGANMDDNLDNLDDEDTLSSTSDISSTTEEPKKKDKNKKKDKYDDNDDDDEIDDDIDDNDLDDEDIDDDLTEEGFIIEQSDINTSDLYKMQKRIFKSDTETEESYTEKVRNAMNTYNQRKKIFNTEDQDILGMNSSTEEYTRKPTRKNSKYH